MTPSTLSHPADRQFLRDLAAAARLSEEACLAALTTKPADGGVASRVHDGRFRILTIRRLVSPPATFPSLAPLSGLTDLDVADDAIERVDLPDQPHLQTLTAARCPRLRDIDLRGAVQLFHIDLSACPSLQTVCCLDLQTVVLRRGFAGDATVEVTPASPEALHRFVRTWNWDGGVEPLRWVVAQDRCDLGTALLAYWLADPVWHQQFATRDEVTAGHDGWDLIRDVERRVAEGFYRSRAIRFDPQDDVVAGGKSRNHTLRHLDLRHKFKRLIPLAMYQPVGVDRVVTARPEPTPEQVAEAEAAARARERRQRELIEKLRRGP